MADLWATLLPLAIASAIVPVQLVGRAGERITSRATTPSAAARRARSSSPGA